MIYFDISTNFHIIGMGTSGSKFRRALLSADEETALKYYTDKVLRKHVNVNEWLFYGRNSPLHLAAGFAMSALLKRFLENGGNPNTNNSRQGNNKFVIDN